MRRIGCLILMACLLLGVFIPTEASADTKQENNTTKIRVGYVINGDVYQGYHYVDENGKFSGYDYEFLQEIAQHVNVSYEFVGGTFDECLEWVNEGKIDLLGGTRYSDERAEKLNFSLLSSGEVPNYLFTTKERTDLKYNQPETFDGIHVGYYQAAAEDQELKDYQTRTKITLKLTQYKTQKEAWDDLRAGKLDAVHAPDMAPPDGMKFLVKLDSSSFYFVTPKTGNPKIMELVNEAMTEIDTENPTFISQLEAKFYDYSKYQGLELTEEELEYINHKKTLTISYDPSFQPYEYIEDGKLCGTSKELLDEIAQETGLEIKEVQVSNYSEAVQLLKQGKIDLLPCLIRNYEYSEEYNAWLTMGYSTSLTSYVYKHKLNLEQKGVVAALPRDYYYSEEVQKKYPNITIRYYDSLKECLNAIRRNQADFTYGDANNLNSYLCLTQYSNLLTVEGNRDSKPLCMAVSKNTDEMLYQIINKVIANMNQDKMKDMIYSYAPTNHKLSLQEYFQENPSSAAEIASVVMLLICFILLLWAYNYTMKEKTILLQKVAQAKSQFLANVSHDLRTPIGAIIGLNEMQQENMERPQLVKECAEKIATTSQHLLSLINDILDLQKMNEGKMVLIEKPFLPKELLQELETVYRSSAEAKGLIYQSEAELSYLGGVCGDAFRIRQVMINFISNAIKYNKPQGSVLVEMKEHKANDPNQVKLEFRVTDTGIGIPKEHQESIFQEFSREEEVIEKRVEGTGLGLAICSKILNLLGSQVHLHSTLGQGSSFWFTLEMEKVPMEIEEKKTVINKKIFAGKQILVVEDNTINMQLITYLLNATGAIVKSAGNGQEAVELFRQSEVGSIYRIVMDIQMPVMDGYEATRQIRAMDRGDAKTVPIIALSANAFAEDMEKSKEAGMNTHCAKPIDREKFFRALSDE